MMQENYKLGGYPVPTSGYVQKGYMQKLKLAIKFTVVFLSVMAFQISAVFAKPIETKAKYIFLIDADTNSVLLSKNADKQFAPASMSKLMTLEVLFQALKAGSVTLEDEFMVSEHAWRTGGGPSGAVSMLLPLNTFVKVEDLIKGVAINSANDAAIVIAEGLEPTEAAFAKRMTKRAKEIGLTHSTFVNATGFDKPGQTRFRIPVSDTQAYKQFGNSVVVPVFSAVANLMKSRVLKAKEIIEKTEKVA